MIGAVVAALWAAAPVGACADRAACRFQLGPDAALGKALEQLGLVAGELPAAPLKKPGGDLAFALTATRQADRVVVRAVSRHRPAAIWGEGSAQVREVPSPWRPRAQASATAQAVGRALEDLKQRISGVRTVSLSALLNGLEPRAREHVEHSVWPCLKGLFDLVGPVTAPALRQGYLDEALEYLPEKDEPRQSLSWQAERLRAALLGGPRARCSVAGTPLQGWSTQVRADELNRAVLLSWRR